MQLRNIAWKVGWTSALLLLFPRVGTRAQGGQHSAQPNVGGYGVWWITDVFRFLFGEMRDGHDGVLRRTG